MLAVYGHKGNFIAFCGQVTQEIYDELWEQFKNQGREIYMTEHSLRIAVKANDLQQEFRALGDREVAQKSQRFFKTGAGQYGEGDQFLGIRVPVLRDFAKQHKSLSLSQIQKILRSQYHEERLLALIMLVNRFEKAIEQHRAEIYEMYLKNTKYINNWDLVDSSAHQIVGGYLMDKNRNILVQLSSSNSLWERRIAIMSTYRFTKNKDYCDTLTISEKLLHDKEDLIHKAVGWMLREIGNRDKGVEEAFLAKYYQTMPRTMLRYAIEKFDEVERQLYLSGQK